MKVKELFKIRKGKKANQEVETYQDDAVRYIQIEDLRNDDNIKYCIKDEDVILANENDIIIAWDGANAATSNYSLKGAIGSTLGRLRPKRDDFYLPYVGLFIKSKQRYLRDNCTGATIPHVDRKVLQNLDIPLPDYEVQKKIAEVIEKTDVLRQKRQQTIAKLDELTQSVFLDMFGDPEINKQEFPKVQIREISKKVTKGESPGWQGFDYVENGVRFITSENVLNGKIDLSNEKFVEDDFHEKLSRSQLQNDDILINIVGASIGRAAIVEKKYLPANINQAVSVLRLDAKKIIPPFLLAHLLFESTQNKLLGKRVESARANISLTNIKELEVILPPKSLQTKFDSMIKKILILKERFIESKLELDNLFNALLQKAFKGELSFSDTEEPLLAAEEGQGYGV